MSSTPKKSVRKLVTLPLDVAVRVDRYRATAGAASESEALKILIEAGLKIYDTQDDLFNRCVESTTTGQPLGDLITRTVADHPLVVSAVMNQEELTIHLRVPTDDPPEEFVFKRNGKIWEWRVHDARDYDRWSVHKKWPAPAKQSSNSAASADKGGSDLDDDIPF